MREHVERNNLDPADFPILTGQPELFPSLMWIWQAFAVLSASRQMGFAGVQPIQLSEIESYCRIKGIDTPEDLEDLIHYVQFMDGIYLTAKVPKGK